MPQVKKLQVGGVDKKVLLTRLYFADEEDKTLELAEIAHTTRDYLGYLAPLQVIERMLSTSSCSEQALCR